MQEVLSDNCDPRDLLPSALAADLDAWDDLFQATLHDHIVERIPLSVCLALPAFNAAGEALANRVRAALPDWDVEYVPLKIGL